MLSAMSTSAHVTEHLKASQQSWPNRIPCIGLPFCGDNCSKKIFVHLIDRDHVGLTALAPI